MSISKKVLCRSNQRLAPHYDLSPHYDLNLYFDINFKISNTSNLPTFKYSTVSYPFLKKLPFFDRPTTRHDASSQMITRAANPAPLNPPLTLRHAWHRSPLYHLFLIFEFENKKQRYEKDMHPPMIYPPMLWSNYTKLSGLNKK